jgi:hypothetical protein
MIEAMGLKIIASRPHEWHYLRINFMKIYKVVQSYCWGTHRQTHTQRQTGDLISLLSFLKVDKKYPQTTMPCAAFEHMQEALTPMNDHAHSDRLF